MSKQVGIELVVKRFDEASLPVFPTDWSERLARFGPGLTVIRSDQCPYIEDATREVVELARQHGAEAQVVQLLSARDVQPLAPSAYGVYDIVYDGELLSHHYLGRKQKESLVQLLSQS